MSTVDYISMFNELSSARNEINRLLLKLEKRVKTAPNGTLRITRKRKGFQYYQKVNVNDTKGKYIPRKEQSLAGKEVGEPSQAPLCRAANTFWIRELSSRTSLSLHVVDLGHLAPLNLGSLIPKTW